MFVFEHSFSHCREWPGWKWSRNDRSSVLTRFLGGKLTQNIIEGEVFSLDLKADKNDFSIVTKNKKKKEREAALKMKKETGARKKENPKGSETKVMLRY